MVRTSVASVWLVGVGIAVALACRSTPTASSGAGTAPAPAPLWGSLRAGPHAVGFRTIYRFDRSRTWQATRGQAVAFAPDLAGRPIRISVWYPAVRDGR